MRVSSFYKNRTPIANLFHKLSKFDIIIVNKINLFFVKYIMPMGLVLIFPEAIKTDDSAPRISYKSKDKFSLWVLDLVVWAMAEPKRVAVFEAVANRAF